MYISGNFLGSKSRFAIFMFSSLISLLSSQLNAFHSQQMVECYFLLMPSSNVRGHLNLLNPPSEITI